MREQPAFLPMFWREAEKQGVEEFDVILISGDGYVDHPSFAAALVGRVLWDAGYSVGIIAQPGQREDFLRLASRDCSWAYHPAMWTPWSTTLPQI